MLKNLCPKCNKGPIMNGWFSVHNECSHCRAKFMGAEGSFTGAMFINYSILAISVFPTLIVGLGIFQLDPWVMGLASFIQILVLSPLTLRYSRIMWVRMDEQLRS